MKKIIVIALNISTINLFGCYYQEQLTPSSYDFDDHSNIKFTSEDTIYSLDGDEYYFKRDTLFVAVSKKIDTRTTIKTYNKIPIENIERLDVEKMDVLGTIGIVVLLSLPLLVIGWLYSY